MRRSSTCEARKITTKPPATQKLKIPEVYLYVGNRCFKAISCVGDDWGEHSGVLWLCVIGVWGNRSS